MKPRNKLIVAMGVSLFALGMTPSFAATSSADLEIAIQKINQQTAELQKEINRLNAELKQVKKESRAAKKPKHSTHAKETTEPAQPPQPRPVASFPQAMASPVVNAPMPGITSLDLDASNLISYQNGMSQSRFFLKQQQAQTKQLNGAPFLPEVILSGKLEGLGFWQSPYGTGAYSSGIDLITAELDIYAQVSEWASAFMAVAYNNSSLNQVLYGSGNPVNNSNIFLNRGYITIGNLDKSPVYFSTGQMYVPFGAYATYTITNPLTKVLGRTNTRAAELGFDNSKGLNASIYAYDGAANENGSNTINNWGANAGYNFTVGGMTTIIGAGYINNIANAQGAQQTSGAAGTSFAGFSQSSATENLVNYVPGANLNLFLGKGPVYFAAEGTMATTSYNINNMSYNAAGAQPKASHLELGYVFKMFGKRSVASVAYERSWEALAMALPQQSYVATLNSSIWKNTIATLEYRHDVNYSSNETAGGSCIASTGDGDLAVCPSVNQGLGGSQNTILAQLGVYF